MKKLVALRRASQCFFLIFFLYILWSTTYPLKGVFSPALIFRTDPNIMLFTSLSERKVISGFALALMFPVLTMVVGRFFCGWICPLGTLIDIAGSVKKRRNGSDRVNRALSLIKYPLLAGIALSAAAGVQIAWVLDPLVISARFVSLNFIPTVTLLLNNIFIILIRDLNMRGGFYDLYRELKSSFLGVKVYYFSNAFPVLLFFLMAVLASLFISRLWCRSVCPLGALYSLLAKFSFLERKVTGCTSCGKCLKECRMGAINKDQSYRKGECVLCMDCVYTCPSGGVEFSFPERESKRYFSTAGSGTATGRTGKGIGRAEFILLLLSSVFLSGAAKRKKERTGSDIVRPPGALKEEEFLSRCVRCGNCMKVCPTNVIQPVLFQSGIEGIWSPHLVYDIGYCEYNCDLCGEVCPTGAIPDLRIDLKKRTKLGLARVNKGKCIAWADDQQCLVCEEHCPVPQKAIKISEIAVNGRTVGRPVIDERLCIGCGICQNKCPVRPVRAVRVYPAGAERM